MVRPTKFEEPLAKPRSFRLRKSDDKEFAKKLKDADLETSAFMREYILNNERKSIVRPQKAITREDRLTLTRMIGQVQKVGDAINQLATQANSGYLAGTLSEEVYRDLLAGLEDISLDLKSCVPKWD